MKGANSLGQTILLVTVALHLSGSPSAHAFSIMGAGAQSCENFLSHIGHDHGDTKGQHMEDLYFSWAQGWMSQLSRKRDTTGQSAASLNPPGFGPSQQRAFLRQTCTNEPRIRYRDAVDRLYDRLLVMSAPQS